jgi:hypothetical protein
MDSAPGRTLHVTFAHVATCATAMVPSGHSLPQEASGNSRHWQDNLFALSGFSKSRCEKDITLAIGQDHIRCPCPVF